MQAPPIGKKKVLIYSTILPTSAVPDPGIPGQCPGKHLVNAIAIVAAFTFRSRLALAATFLHLIPTKVIVQAYVAYVLRLYTFSF